MKSRYWYFNRDQTGSWYKIYTENLNKGKQIARWKGCYKLFEYARSYRGKPFAIDVVVPSTHIRRACNLLGVVLEKNPERAKNALLSDNELQDMIFEKRRSLPMGIWNRGIMWKTLQKIRKSEDESDNTASDTTRTNWQNWVYGGYRNPLKKSR